MKNFFRMSVAMVLILALVLSPVLAIAADSTGTPHRYDPFSEGIVSSYYHIDRENGFITGIAPGTAAQQLLKVCLPGDATVSHEMLVTGSTITVTCTEPIPPETPPAETTEPSAESTEPPSEAPEATGESTETSSDATGVPSTPRTTPETKSYTLTVIVTGDLNGDGNVTITDMLMLKSAVLGEALSDTAAAAADLNFDGKITITDFLKAKSCLLGLETISGGWVAGTAPEDPLLLMTPNASDSWSVQGAASYQSGDERIAAVDSSGVLSSTALEGSTFVYALDAAGNVIGRIMVTVLKEKLTISLGESSRSLVKGQTLTLAASFNHPIAVPISWTSSDPNIVSVDQNGTLTAKGLGTAVITASLGNGSKAECTIHVIPPLTDIAFSKPLYKLKPGHSRTLNVTLTPADTDEELLWSSSNTSIATVSSDGTVTGVAYGTATITVKGKYSGLTASCKVKICNVKQVAITFDDGPSNYTAELLDYLRKVQVPATFFMVGNRLQPYSNTLSRMVADGHEIGYHSYDHTLQSYLSSDEIKAAFNNSSKILKELTGASFTVWRAPGGDISERILGCIPLPHIMWSVDTLDWETQSSDSNYRYITSAEDGDIILLHDLYAPSVNGAIRAIEDMEAGDYEFLTVTELLSRNGTPPQNHTSYTNAD